MKNFSLKYLAFGFFLIFIFVFTGCSSSNITFDDNSEVAKYKLAERTIRDGQYIYKVKVFDGIGTICNIDDTDNKILKVNLSVDKGDFSLIYADDKNGEFVLADDTFEGDIDLSQYSSGKLKIKGKKASFSFNIEIVEK